MSAILLKGGTVVDTAAKRLRKADVLARDGIIAEINERGIAADQDCEVLDCRDLFLSPGLVDSHLHIESSMLSPLEFAGESVTRGTTTVMVDPHEIANVFGMEAVRLFMDLAEDLPYNMLVAIPSCVPSTDMEHAGASITLNDVLKIMNDPRIYGLAEMMNFPGIIHGLGDARAKVEALYGLGKIVDGHCPGVLGQDLRLYISNGHGDGVVRIMNDHETTSPTEALEKLSAGMYLSLRYGSAVKDMDTILPGILRDGRYLSRCMLCSDDLSAQEMRADGHMDRTVRRCRDIIMKELGAGMEEAAIEALVMATKTPGEYLAGYHSHHGLPRTGVLEAGYRADITVFDSLRDLKAVHVLSAGRVSLRDGTLTWQAPARDLSPFTGSIHLAAPLKPEDFHVAGSGDRAMVRCIDVISESLLTGSLQAELPVMEERIMPDAERDIAMISVFERHHATGSHSTGFVHGLGLKKGALASTVAHDSHNLVIVGYDPAEMARLGNHMMKRGGGIAVSDGEAIHHLPLEIAGLMSTGDIESVISRYSMVREAARKLGSPLKNVFMTMSFLSLPVIPELKITDMGLVDVNMFSFVPLVE